MATSILILIVSTALLLYWFRYTCLLILRTPAGKDFASGFAAANKLRFTEVRQSVAAALPGDDVSDLARALERDYRLVAYLLRSTADARVGGVSVEQRMLMLDFHVMRVVALFARQFRLPQARAAVVEMSDVLRHLSNDLGARAASSAQI